jgi:arylsulfatase
MPRAWSLLAACLLASVSAADEKKPNVVVLLSDDMGFSDLGCYGGEIATPNLDRLAENGLRFTQFYNTARCCPTRASLLTGLYPHQAGVGHMMDDKGRPGYAGDLNKECRTIAEVLRPAGYRSYAVGKWHVTRHTAADGPKHNWPLGRGFDRFYGTIHGAGSFYDPTSLVRDNTMIPRTRTGSTPPKRTTTPTPSPTTPCGSWPTTPGTMPASRSFCTSRSPPPIGRCTPCRRTSRSTRGSTPTGTSRSARPGSRGRPGSG